MTDAVAAVRAWGNAQTALVGAGKPVALGFFDRRLRSPGRGCFGLVEADLSGDGVDAEGLTQLWRLSVGVYSPTDKEAAEQGALALAAALRAVSTTQPVAAGMRLLMAVGVVVDDDSSSDDEPLFTVKADLYTA